jgi:chromosome segregation ATPase
VFQKSGSKWRLQTKRFTLMKIVTCCNTTITLINKVPYEFLLTERNYSKNEKYNDHIEELRSENHHLMEKYNQIKKENELMKRDMIDIHTHQGDNTVSLDEYQQVVDENQELRDKIDDLHGQIKKERNKSLVRHEEYNFLQETIETNQEQLDQLKKMVQNMKDTLAEKQKYIEQLTQNQDDYVIQIQT